MRRREPKERPGQTRPSETFFQPVVQKKRAVGKSGDKFEKEADSVADKVVNKTGSGDIQRTVMPGEEEKVQQKPVAESISSVQKKELKEEEQPVQKIAEKKEDEKAVQKKDDEKKDDVAVQKKVEEEQPVQKAVKEDDKAVQKKEDEKKDDVAVQKKEEEEQPVQKAAREDEKAVQKKEDEKKDDVAVQKKEEDSEKKGPAAPTIEEKLKSRKGKGSPLSKEIKAEMDREFKTNFRDVRIHTDKEAQELAHSLGAQAFTYGTDIYFNAGKYNPTTQEGRFLLAHELTHVLQQRNSPGLLKND